MDVLSTANTNEQHYESTTYEYTCLVPFRSMHFSQEKGLPRHLCLDDVELVSFKKLGISLCINSYVNFYTPTARKGELKLNLRRSRVRLRTSLAETSTILQ